MTFTQPAPDPTSTGAYPGPPASVTLTSTAPSTTSTGAYPHLYDAYWTYVWPPDPTAR